MEGVFVGCSGYQVSRAHDTKQSLKLLWSCDRQSWSALRSSMADSALPTRGSGFKVGAKLLGAKKLQSAWHFGVRPRLSSKVMLLGP